MNNWDWMRWYSAHQGQESRRAVLAMLLLCNPSIAGMGISLGRQFWRLMSGVRWRCRDWKMVQWFRWVGGARKRMHESSVSTLLFCHKCSPYTEHCLDVCSERVKIWSITGIYVWFEWILLIDKGKNPLLSYPHISIIWGLQCAINGSLHCDRFWRTVIADFRLLIIRISDLKY